MYCSIELPIPIEKKVCHAHSNGHKPPKPVAPTIIMLDKNVNTPTLTPITLKSVYRKWVAHFNVALLLAYLYFPLVPLAE